MAAGLGTVLPNLRANAQQTTTIQVAQERRQLIRLGIDAERLWFWHSAIKAQLAHAAVGELESEFVRVGISAAYERERGVKDEAAYDEILEMMTALRAVNPRVHFFGSPRPMHEAYAREEKTTIWGHRDNVPFSPFPVWIQQWHQNGTKRLKDGTVVPRWAKGAFDVEGYVQYYADYLNLMHRKGFAITYLDVTNEQTIITPAHTKYLHDHLPSRLAPGITMPKLIAPSSWSVEGGIDWLKAVDPTKDEHLAFSIAAAHNTGSKGNLTDFAREAAALDKEVWNTELHGWIGTEPRSEILNSAVFWEYLRAGFTGIDTWLFYGPLAGRDHTMINSDGKTINRSVKYEIFKQVVNNANGGHFIPVTSPKATIQTAGFVRGKVLSVWILNTSSQTEKTAIDLSAWEELDDAIDVITWESTTPASGRTSKAVVRGSKSLAHEIPKESLCFFKVRLP